jgi:choline kinase
MFCFMTWIDPAWCRVLILAAGQGCRLGLDAPPKGLLRFRGCSLLARHLDILAACGVRRVTIVVGYRSEDMRAELCAVQSDIRVELIENPAFRDGSVVSLWQARRSLGAGSPVILMDADVLYDWRLMERLLGSRHENCFLLDRAIEPGEEPVKLCISGGRIVDFHKRPQIDHDWHGESVGFFRFSPKVAAELATRAEGYIVGGRTGMEYEEPIRDLVLARDGQDLGFEDISGLPWIEIDFPQDVERAGSIVLPRLLA